MSIEYLPYGEIWVEDASMNSATGASTSSATSNSSGYSTPYKFTGKELDKETNLYYFGARYYDARISRWISTDPVLQEGKYFLKANDYDTEHDFYWYIFNDANGKLPGMGGMYNVINIDLYHYAGNNPIKYIDPDGKTLKSNFKFLIDFILGKGETKRIYDQESIESKEMQKSPGAEALRSKFYEGGGKDITSFAYETFKAAYDTLLNPKTADWFETSAQVGGFAGASAKRNKDGTVTFTIINIAGTKSFFYHVTPNRKGSTGPMRNITQIFQWVEKIDESRIKNKK